MDNNKEDEFDNRSMEKDIKFGKYIHYKGNNYEVIGVAKDSETLEDLVIYRALYDSPKFGDNALWVRKKTNFQENVNQNGQLVSRFRYIDKSE